MSVRNKRDQRNIGYEEKRIRENSNNCNDIENKTSKDLFTTIFFRQFSLTDFISFKNI